MPAFRYRRSSLTAGYVRAAVGLALTAGTLVLVEPADSVALVLAALSALFLVYLALNVVRQSTRIEYDEAGIRAVGPLGAAIRWDDLRSVRLHYYSTRTDRRGGWMQMVVRGARGALRIDSDLEGFAEVARAAARAAEQHGCALGEDTRANLRSLDAAGTTDG
jgi:hypothetical protein